jgi:hypothetical protein
MASPGGMAGKPGAFYENGQDGLLIHHGGKDLTRLGKLIRKRHRKKWEQFYISINNEAVLGRPVAPFSEWSTKHKEVCWLRQWVDVLKIGINMDRIADGLSESREELKEIEKDFQSTVNDLITIQDEVERRIVDHITKLRTARMTAVAEIALSTQALKDVRRFFMDSDYHEEMRRLRDFADVCERLYKLKQTGVLDAICDSALHLAVKE